MDLTALGPLAGTLMKSGAAVLGGALGGPAGAALAPAIIGALAEALGLPADAGPGDVDRAIKAAPDAGQEAVRQVEAARAADVMSEMNALMMSVNETARAELVSEDRFVKWARPFSIWVIGGATAAYSACIVIAVLIYLATRNVDVLRELLTRAFDVSIALTPCGAVAGITSWGRTREKLASEADAVIDPPMRAARAGKGR